MSSASTLRTVGSIIVIGATLVVVINQLVSRGVLDEPGEFQYYCGLCHVEPTWLVNGVLLLGVVLVASSLATGWPFGGQMR